MSSLLFASVDGCGFSAGVSAAAAAATGRGVPLLPVSPGQCQTQETRLLRGRTHHHQLTGGERPVGAAWFGEFTVEMLYLDVSSFKSREAWFSFQRFTKVFGLKSQKKLRFAVIVTFLIRIG